MLEVEQVSSLIPRNQLRLRVSLLKKFGKISPKALAEEINRRKGTSITRQAVHQVLTGDRETEWIQEAIAEILEKDIASAFPDAAKRRQREAEALAS